MSKVTSAIIAAAMVAATLFAVGSATAQTPPKGDVSLIANGESNKLAAAAAQQPTVTGTAQAGALNACYAAIGNQPRTALKACLDRKISEAASQMNAAYKTLYAKTKSVDSSATAKALVSLRRSQSSFNTFKDAQCQWQGDAAMGGSGSGDFQGACKADLMSWRTSQLAE